MGEENMTKVWLIPAIGYGLFSWAARKRRFAEAALSFWNGGYLAFLSFAALPAVMGTDFFYAAAAAAGAGILVGVALEEKCSFLPSVIFAAVTGGELVAKEGAAVVLLFAFLGGMGLFHASCGILPEKVEIKKAVLSGGGFLTGTILFAAI